MVEAKALTGHSLLGGVAALAFQHLSRHLDIANRFVPDVFEKSVRSCACRLSWITWGRRHLSSNSRMSENGS